MVQPISPRRGYVKKGFIEALMLENVSSIQTDKPKKVTIVCFLGNETSRSKCRGFKIHIKNCNSFIFKGFNML